jgi:NitT/TauT family transport system ATP-binding protein
MADPAIVLKDVYKLFPAPDRGRDDAFVALAGVDLQVARGEFLTLVGPSGCGKSTVLNLVAGLAPVTRGEVRCDGRPVSGLNRAVGYITQDDNLLPWRTLTGNVELALEFRGVPREERRRCCAALLGQVGLGGFEGHYPHQLSGGMRKRAAIVRTLAYDPAIILMDEPFGPLDAQTRLILQDQLLRLWEGSGRTIVFVTHDIVEAIALSDRVAIVSSSPGRLKAVHPIPIPRPRDVFHIHSQGPFAALYDTIWAELREELAGGFPRAATR